MPWQIRASIALIAVSLAPSWLNDMTNAPVAASIRLWTTVVIVVLLIGVGARINLLRLLLAALVVIGAGLEAYALIATGGVATETVLITGAQLVGVALLFTPAGSAWFGRSARLASPADES